MLDTAACRDMMEYVADGIISNEAMLTEADKMGDADHGAGMALGFSKVKEALAGKEFSDLKVLFSSCGTSIMMNSGGASGAVFGTLFRDGGAALKECTVLDAPAFSAFLDAALAGVMKRGKASPGDKTMVDALFPAAEAARGCTCTNIAEVMQAAADAAEQGSESTKTMTPKAGRMRSLGERALGHTDPGSITMNLILKYMHQFVLQR